MSKVGIEGNFINLINSIYKKPTPNIILNGERVSVFPVRSGTSQGYLFSPLILNTVLEVLARAIRQESVIKGTQTVKKEIQFSLLANNLFENQLKSKKGFWN